MNLTILFSFLVGIFASLNGVVHSTPGYVMLPLDTTEVHEDGTTYLQDPQWLEESFEKLQKIDMYGVMSDCWWGLVEKNGPKQYDFSAYTHMAELAQKYGLHIQMVLSFHKCGTNVGDECYIPIPSWLNSPDGVPRDEFFYKGSSGSTTDEYISLFADHEKFDSLGRTPMQMYADFMQAFQEQVIEKYPNVVTEVQVGGGPAGELRYPSYQLEDNRWSYCGVGEFQSYDRFASAKLVNETGLSNPEKWSVGDFNCKPGRDNGYCRFFSDSNMDKSFASDYGQGFLTWYSKSLLTHGDELLGAAREKFGDLDVSMKVSGIHWWYDSYHHGAELTAGYYNTNNNDAYAMIAEMFKKNSAIFCFTCFEMTDKHSGDECASRAGSLLSQTKEAVRKISSDLGAFYAGENALPTSGHDSINRITERSKDIKSFTWLRLTKSSNWDDLAYLAQQLGSKNDGVQDGGNDNGNGNGNGNDNNSSDSTPSYVMFQSFNWDLISDEYDNEQVYDEILKLSLEGLVNAVWFPPPSQSADNRGYMPGEWYTLKNEEKLREAIAFLKEQDVVAVVDTVLNHRTGATVDPCTGRYTQFSNPDWGNWAVVKNDNRCETDGGGLVCQDGCQCSENEDSGANYCAAPDIDHANLQVQNDTIAWLKWLRDDIGFEGFRLDLVKGYDPAYAKMYMGEVQPKIAVGEFFDGNVDLVTEWMDVSGLSAFDFPLRWTLEDAVKNGNYWKLKNGIHPPGLLAQYKERSFTFLDNHDFKEHGGGYFAWGREDLVLQGYAYLLTHPGNPTIFYDHWMNEKMQKDIKQLLQIRKSAKISADSAMYIVASEQNLYATYVGSSANKDDRCNYDVAMKLGSKSWYPGSDGCDGFDLATSGENWAVWKKSQSASLADTSFSNNETPSIHEKLIEQTADTNC